MQPTSSFAPFTELVIDPFRNLCICGNTEGQIFLATQEFCNDILPSLKGNDLHVIHVEEARPTFRLPLRSDDIVGPRDEVIEIERYAIPFSGGFYLIYAGYSFENETWIMSGEADWFSPLRLELSRNMGSNN